MFDTILSGCDGIRQYPSKWFGNHCEVMRIPDMEYASPVQAIRTILIVYAGQLCPTPRDDEPIPDDLVLYVTPIALSDAPLYLDDILLRQ